MTKASSKKRRRKTLTKNEKPTAVLRFDPDIGVTYIKLIVRYRDCMTKRSDLGDQMAMFTAMGGVEHESSNVSSGIEHLDQEIHQLKLSLVDIGVELKKELYAADVDAGLIKRLELRGWLDDSLYEDLCVLLDECRCKRKLQQDGSKQEATGNESSLSLAAPKHVIADALGIELREFNEAHPHSLKKETNKRWRAKRAAFLQVDWDKIVAGINAWTDLQAKSRKKMQANARR